MMVRVLKSKRNWGAASASLLALCASTPALAQEVAATDPAATSSVPQATAAPSPNAMVNLIRLLVKQGVITQENGDALLAQAEAEAARARAAQPAPTPAGGTALASAPPAGTTRVAYVPEVVKKQIRDELKQEVLAQAKSEGWAAPDKLPEWIDRITWSGDVRFRSQWEFLNNTNIPAFVDFSRINSAGPIDFNPVTNLAGVPFTNTLFDRGNRFRLRARLAMEAEITDAVKVGIRLATGDNDGPVSTNGSLGGGFSKKNIWLDRGYIMIDPVDWGGLTFGRMPNPFFSTDLLWDDDLNFDGVAGRLSSKAFFDDSFEASLTLGLFPLEYPNSNFPTNSDRKTKDVAKWLYAAQAKIDWEVMDDVRWRLAGGYYTFRNVQSELSSPCALFTGITQCDSDLSRPVFMQRGNTLFPIRLIVENPNVGVGLTALPQFVGLTFDYDILNLTTEISAKLGSTYQVSVQADYVKNLGYKSGDLCRFGAFPGPLTNVVEGFGTNDTGQIVSNANPCGPQDPDADPARFESGDMGFLVKASFGTQSFKKFGDFNVTVGYRRLEPDAVLDAYTDSDFGLGGTNTKGYFASGTLGLYKNVRLTGRWLSANEVYGAPLAIDVLQLDLNVGF
jgi:Putative porin